MSETTQDLLAKAYEMQRTDAALAMLRERDYWERRALQAEAQLLAATPPTPDLAAVREADFAAAERYAHTAMQAGGPLLDNLARAYLALLAAVSRPAEARGELLAWQKYALHLAHCGSCAASAMHCAEGQALRDTCFDTDWAAHPAQSGGEAAPRPEPGEPSEAMVEAAAQETHKRFCGDDTWYAASEAVRESFREDARAILRAAKRTP